MVPLIIYFVVPLLGLASFVHLRRRMQSALAVAAPVQAYAFLFVAYGGVLLVLLTDRFWLWSGMASIGTALLLLVAPPLAIFQAWKLRTTARLSRYHRAAATLSWAYPIAAGAMALEAATR